jgi:hypothetical protein
MAVSQARGVRLCDATQHRGRPEPDRTGLDGHDKVATGDASQYMVFPATDDDISEELDGPRNDQPLAPAAAR